MRHGLLLLAHGARNPEWARPFIQLASQLQALRPQDPVAVAYLEFMSPDLDTAGQSLVASGCTRVDVLPAFLGSAGHVLRDIPPRLQALREAHPQVEWVLHAALGEQAAVINAMALAAHQLIEQSPQAPAAN
ncbi:sirohydrochlorin chelatase [Roseateles sp. BYS180W]|uniref:Sirohydrochlorin chelatase n=1 Tax=Roseateles rivi TaxID=3299028 RepID=A0ABW7FXS0_9BURK